MNVATCEMRKVEAMEAWQRGDLVAAGAAYGELAGEYERHHFGEGLLAVRFNHLLVALEAGDRPRVDALMASLGSQFLQVGAGSPLVGDIARRICRLFAEPVPGVDHQATGALVALAADKAGNLEVASPPPGDEALPPAHALAALDAEDVALLVLRAAARPAGREEPAWLGTVRRAFADLAPLSASAASLLREAAEAVAADDLLHGYPSLVDALEWAVSHNGALAAEWAVGLSELEARGLPERLDYVPTLPEYRRLRASLALHARLAEAMSGEAGAEPLAAAQWRRVERLGRQWFERTRARVARGGGRAEDITHEAEVGILLARALRARCAFADARALLAPSIARARRDAFDQRITGIRVLCEAAELVERAGEAAEEAWQSAVDAALPGIEAAAGMGRLARVVDRVLTEGDEARAGRGVQALAGLARTGARELARPRLERARTLLAMLRPTLAPERVASAALVIELSAARIGDLDGAGRALEAARVCGDRQAVALAALYQAHHSWSLAADAGARAEALERLADAAAEARRVAGGAVRRAVEAGVAEVHRSGVEGTDPARAEVHLRRAVEAAEGAACGDGAGRWDHLLPPDRALNLERVIEELVGAGDAALARRLCSAGRREASAPIVDGALAERVQRQHRRAFASDWLGERADDVAAPITWPEPEHNAWPALRRSPTDLKLELRVFDHVTFLFAVDGQGVRAHRVDRGRLDWAADVDALRDAAHSSGTRLEAVGTAVRNRLLGPVDDLIAHARRVVFVPDGPLVDLPFGLLRTETGYLGELLEMVVALPTPPPAFDADTAPAPPEARIVGDEATARDLRISTLSGQGFFSAVDVRYGEDLEQGLEAALEQARVVHLLGALDDTPAVSLIADGAPTSAHRLGSALARAGSVCATLMGPVEGEAGEAVVRALLPGLRGGVLVRRWESEEDGSFLLHFLAGAAHGTDTWALAEALAAARRAAVRANLPPSVWAAYSLIVAEA